MNHLTRLTMLLAVAALQAPAQPAEDIVIKGGHVIDAAEAKSVINATVLSVTPGLIDIHFHGYAGTGGARLQGTKRLSAEATIRKGAVVYDLNGIAATDWKSFPYEKILPIAKK